MRIESLLNFFFLFFTQSNFKHLSRNLKSRFDKYFKENAKNLNLTLWQNSGDLKMIKKSRASAGILNDCRKLNDLEDGNLI